MTIYDSKIADAASIIAIAAVNNLARCFFNSMANSIEIKDTAAKIRDKFNFRPDVKKQPQIAAAANIHENRARGLL